MNTQTAYKAGNASSLNGEWTEHSFTYDTPEEANEVLDAVKALYVPQKGWELLESAVEQVSDGFRAMWRAQYSSVA